MTFTFHMPEGYSTADLVALNKVHTKRGKIRRWLIPVLRVVLTLGGILLVLGTSLLLACGGAEDGRLLSIVVFFVVGILSILVGLFHYRISAWNSQRLTIRDLGSITVTLDEEGISEITGKGSALHSYAAFAGAACYRDILFLFLDKNHAMILPYAAMTGGTAAELEAFWTRHSNLPIQHFDNKQHAD